MDAATFDRLARALTQGRTRRGLLAPLAAGLAALLRAEQAAAAKDDDHGSSTPPPAAQGPP